MDKRFLLFIVTLTVSFWGINTYFDQYRPKPKVTTTAASTSPKKEPITPKKDPVQFQVSAEKKSKTAEYYVLENSYLQLVFSNIGGAACEINLPFQNKADKKSVVLPVEFDRVLKKDDPMAARFPLHPAKKANGKMLEPQLGGYYPLIRRDLPNTRIQPRYYALNVVSEYPEVAELVYDVTKFTDSEIVFETTQEHRRITKRFQLPKNADQVPYCFQAEIDVEGEARGLSVTSGVPEAEWISGATGNVIKYNLLRGKSSTVEKIDLPKETFQLTSIQPDWICNSNGFFGLILDPLSGAEAGFKAEFVPGTIAPSRLTLIDKASNRFPAKDLPGYDVLVPIRGGDKSLNMRVFAGPFADSVLTTVDKFFANEQGGRDSDYLACQTFHGWFAFISEPFAKFLFILMNFFHSLFGSWALSIVLITCVLRLLLYPLNTWSMRSMKKMQLVGPELKIIQEKYKKDPAKAREEMMKLYRLHGVNPFSGCVPLLIQMPFLIGMFDLLKSSFELRGASFIPGWINDLSAPDTLFSWNFSIPFIGNEFHLLPFILGGIMFVQQNMMSNLPKDPKEWTDQQRQQKSMGTIMTVMMTFLFYNFPSGLNIYWISSMVLAIIQQWWTNRSMTTLVAPKKTK